MAFIPITSLAEMQPPVIPSAVAMMTSPPSDGAGAYGQRVAQMSVRIPDDLHSRIKAIAAHDGVSLNVWLCLAAAEKAAGSLRAEDVKRLDDIEQRLKALEDRSP